MREREKTCRDILNRLRRIEGQVRGLQKMIQEGKDCADIVTQLSAARGALDRVGFLVLSHWMAECVQQKGERELRDAMGLFLKLT